MGIPSGPAKGISSHSVPVRWQSGATLPLHSETRGRPSVDPGRSLPRRVPSARNRSRQPTCRQHVRLLFLDLTGRAAQRAS